MDDKLTALIEKARSRVMTPAEAYEQRVSFIYGQLMDAAPDVTEDDIRAFLASVGIFHPDSGKVEPE